MRTVIQMEEQKSFPIFFCFSHEYKYRHFGFRPSLYVVLNPTLSSLGNTNVKQEGENSGHSVLKISKLV